MDEKQAAFLRSWWEAWQAHLKEVQDLKETVDWYVRGQKELLKLLDHLEDRIEVLEKSHAD